MSADEAEPTPEAVPEATPEAKEAKETKEPKETKTFEERLAELKKPDPVPNPDQDAVNEKLSRLNAKIEKCDKRLSEIKSALDKANTERDRSKDSTKGIIELLKANRARMSNASREKEKCYQALRDMTAARQAQQKSLQDMRRSLKFQDVGEVEARVRELESMIEQGRCGNLAEEKRTIQEIKQLNQMKNTINQYQTQRSTVVEDPATKSELEARKAAAVAEIDVCKKENEKLEKELEAKRATINKEGGPNINDLWKEQKEIYGQIKVHRAEIRSVNGDFKEEVNKWRDYQRVLNSYKKAQGRILQEQRRAEWEARRADVDEPMDKDAPTDDPLVGHPWADEMLMCSDLEKCLSVYLPKEESKAEEAKSESATKAVEGTKGALSRGDADDFAGLVKSKKSKGKKSSGPPKEVKIVLSVDTISSLSTIGVSIPTSADQIAGTITEVKAKREAFMGMTEDDKKKKKSDKKEKKSDKSEKKDKEADAAAAAADANVVDVNISAAGNDVKVKIDFPSLGA